MLRIPFVTVEALFAALWLLCRAAVWLKNGRIDRKREAVLLLMYVNLAVILRFTFFPMALADGRVQPLLFSAASVFPLRVNLIPIVKLFQYRSRRVMLINAVGNFALFVPSGFLLPLVYKRLDGFGKTVGAAALLSLGIELLQLPFSVRASDVDDLILNTLGAAFGFGLYALLRAVWRKKRRRGRD